MAVTLEMKALIHSHKTVHSQRGYVGSTSHGRTGMHCTAIWWLSPHPQRLFPWWPWVLITVNHVTAWCLPTHANSKFESFEAFSYSVFDWTNHGSATVMWRTVISPLKITENQKPHRIPILWWLGPYLSHLGLVVTHASHKRRLQKRILNKILLSVIVKYIKYLRKVP